MRIVAVHTTVTIIAERQFLALFKIKSLHGSQQTASGSPWRSRQEPESPYRCWSPPLNRSFGQMTPRSTLTTWRSHARTR
jgi:hypothetical protein